MRAKDKPCETDERIRENTREFENAGVNRSKRAGKLENKEQTARKRLGALRTRRKPLQSNRKKEQTVRKRLENLRTGSKCSKEIREFKSKQQAARKRLENLKTGSKPVERD